jgi:putative addiction module component (TIGR02574 family)
MTESIARIKTQVDNLSTEERAELAHYLIQSLDREVDEDADAAWETELARRVAEIENGTAKGRPADEVMADLRKKYPWSRWSFMRTRKRSFSTPLSITRSAKKASARTFGGK